MAKITVVQPNIPAVVANLGRVPRRMMGSLHQAFDNHGSSITAKQAARTPVDTGELRSGNLYKVKSRRNRVELILSNDTPYAKFVEFGTGQAGSAAPPEYFPPSLEWAYGPITGYRARPYFYPPILEAQIELLRTLLILSAEVANYAVD